MRTELKIEPCPSPFCVIHAAEKNWQVEQIAEKISLINADGEQVKINGWDGDFCIPLKPSDIYRIYSMDKKVFAETESENLLIKMRLYEFEEMIQKCGLSDFIRISNTDIVNFSKVRNLDMTFSGIVKVNFTNGNYSIVSRRYVSKIRDVLCLKK